jgi:iron complex outermembrane receptor protein/vitamin B12 transporter
MKILILALLLGSVSWAQEATPEKGQKYETVVYGGSFNSTSKIVLEENEIRQSKATNLTTLLATQANISISNSNIQPGSIYLRGGDASHVLILVDGLPFYDASTVQRTINLNQIDIKTIRRIEILKGSQSVLYGGQALSGVIKIETFPKEMSSKYGVFAEGGERNYKKAGGAVFVPTSVNQGLLARIEGAEKDNRSPVLDSSETYRGRLFTGDLGYLYSSDYDAFFKVGQIADRNEISDTNPFTYKAIDAKDFVAETNIRSLTAGLNLKKSSAKPKLLVGYQNSDRSFIQRPSADQKYGANLWNIRFESLPLDVEAAQILLGASYVKEDFIYRDSGLELANAFNEQKGLFSKGTLTLGPVNLEAGLRTEYYKKQDHIESYQLGLSAFDLVKFEYSTGFKAPSLFQLYSIYGNQDLKPEKAQTYSVSFENQLNKSQYVSLAFFETHFSDLITTQGSYPNLKYYNVSRAETRGVEFQYSHQLESGLRGDLSLGYQEPRDVEKSQWLLRRPLQSGSLRLTQNFQPYEIGYELMGNGERVDRFSNTEYGSLPAYFVSNTFASMQVNTQTSVYIRGNNIFNERFEESRGYFNEGAFWLAGVELTN